MARTYQDLETLRLAINEALGGTNNSAQSDTRPVQTFSELAAAFQELGGTVG